MAKRIQEEDFSDCPPKRPRIEPDFKLTASLPKGSLRCYEYEPEEAMDIPNLFTEVYTALTVLLLTELEKGQYKCSLILHLTFIKPFDREAYPHFQSKPMVILTTEDIETFLKEAYAQLDKHVDKFTNDGSGWILDNVLSLSVNIAKYTPLKGASYIDLPAYLKRKKAIVNVRNYDQHCLKWAILSCLHPAKDHPQRVNKYMEFKELNFTGVDFPTPLNKISKVEQLNNLAINVFGYSKKVGIHPLYLTKDLTRDPINLLLTTEVKDGKTLSHYSWIKNFNRLCSSETNIMEKRSSASAASPPTHLSGPSKTTSPTAEELMLPPAMLCSRRSTKKLGIFPKPSSGIMRTR